MISLLRRIRERFVSWLLRNCCEHSPNKALLLSDAQRWSPARSLASLFICFPEFRSLFFYRIGKKSLSAQILKRFFQPLPTLYISTSDIGPGLYLQHGFSTIVAAKCIGKNCWINQQVTIGHTHAGDCPTIGDDVAIGAGAIIVGNITIGDRVKIGAGAVVVKSVPPDSTVVSPAAFIVKRNGVRVAEKL